MKIAGLLVVLHLLIAFSACSQKQVLPLPQKGPDITELKQQDLYPVADVQVASSETILPMPTLVKKQSQQQFSDELIISWTRSGSGVDLLHINQSLQTTWQLLNKALIAGDYAIEDVKEKTGVVEVALSEAIIMPANDKSILGFLGNGLEEFYQIEFRVDALSDGTIISLQLSDDLLLPEADNLRELDRIKTLLES